MIKKTILYLIILLPFCLIAQVQQVELDPITAEHGREVLFDWQNGNFVQVNQLYNQPAYLRSNNHSDNDRYFAFFQWTIPDNLIPDGSTIDYVRFFASTTGSNTYEIKLSHNAKDITSENLTYGSYNTEIYDNLFCTFSSPPSSPLDYNTDDNPELNGIKTVIENSLPNDRLTLVVISHSMPADNYLNTDFPTLTITYTPPSQTVTVSQKLSTGVEFGEIEHWESSQWISYPTGHQYTFGIDAVESFQALTSVYNNEKFLNWEPTVSYLNFSSFTIEEGFNQLVGNFSAIKNITVTNNLEDGSASDNGIISFIDPWFRDDNSDTRATRNRGINAIPHSYPSPYEVTTSGEHQGVFLEQTPDPQNPDKPYYTVKAENGQTININGRDHAFYFQNWEAEPEGSATFQDDEAEETAVVFHDAGATVKAVMKGTQLSDDANAYSNSGQRKVLRTSDGNMTI